MDNGTLALILSPIAIILTGLITQWVSRRNHRDDTDISSFQANLDAYKGRADYAEQRAINAEKNAEARMVIVEAKLEAQEKQLHDLHGVQIEQAQKIEAQSKQISRMRTIVRNWFKDLKAQWTGDHPMPLPSKEDLELLGIIDE